MLSTQFRTIIIVMLKENSKAILGKALKDYEIQDFLNLYEEQIEALIFKTKHKLEVAVNQYLEAMK